MVTAFLHHNIFTSEQCGIPLALYVDYHSFFFTHVPDHMTYLGWALHFYDISLKYAPTPQTDRVAPL